MPTYRAYLLSDDHIKKPAHIIEASDDAAAVKQAKQYVNGHDVDCGAKTSVSRS